jgi:D-sedoheptulose 7-phosphate isomerase
MKEKTKKVLDDLTERIPELEGCKQDILSAYTILYECFAAGGKLLICGNGGSSADSEHIVGELMKGFNLKRPIPQSDAARPAAMFPQEGASLASGLQCALPAISLTSHTALSSAYINDVDAAMAFAQQAYGLGRLGDALLGISTSGNSANVVNAAKVSRAMGLRTIGLTGGDGGNLAAICDASVIVPARETYLVQEYHLPVYHALCAMLEYEFFL